MIHPSIIPLKVGGRDPPTTAVFVLRLTVLGMLRIDQSSE